MRWDERQRPVLTQEEEARWKVQDFDGEINQKWTAVYQWTAKKMLKYLEDGEVMKVSTRELHGSSVNVERIARQARCEKSKKLFQNF